MDIFGKKGNNCKQKFSFFIKYSTITDSQVSVNEFVDTIGRKLSKYIVSTVSPLSHADQVINSVLDQ